MEPELYTVKVGNRKLVEETLKTLGVNLFTKSHVTEVAVQGVDKKFVVHVNGCTAEYDAVVIAGTTNTLYSTGSTAKIKHVYNTTSSTTACS